VELENNLNDKINKQIKRNSHSSEENKKLEIFEKKRKKI
jgi:hypothetical protein